MTLLAGDRLLDRMEELLRSSDSIDIAVAWAGECPAMEKLYAFGRRGGKLRVALGLSGNATHPSTLIELHTLGALRIGEPPRPGTGLFHPKCYCFRNASTTVVWVGSANLTRGGFANNLELVHEFTTDPGPLPWFESVWSSLEADPTDAIRRYKADYVPPRSATSRELSHSRRSASTVGQLSSDWSWGDFVENLWAKHDALIEAYDDWSVFGDDQSYLHTISVGKRISRLESWSNLQDWQADVLCGIPPWGSLGDMRVAATAVQILSSADATSRAAREDIRQHLKPTIDAEGDDLIRVGVDAMRRIRRPHIAHGVITRLLALARPDAFVSLNSKSMNELAECTGLAPARLRRYGELLEWVHACTWYREPEPTDPFEREIWEYRAALVDVFVYRSD